MPTPGATHRIYRFGEFTLDIERGALLKASEERRLRPKAFEVLRFLVERSGHLVSKDELLEAVWSPAVVSEDSITQCLMEIRRALDDHDQVMIRTLPRRGYLFDVPVSGPDAAPAGRAAGAPPPPARAQNRSRRLIYVATLALLTLAFWLLAAYRHENAPEVAHKPPTFAETASIAVLPFVDMSYGHDQGYLADGISEEIINRLVRIPGLRVIARTSSFSFRGQQADIGRIAARLNVANVLEGSVRKSGDRIRITTQLIRAADSSHLWSQIYDHNLGDVFAVQDDIATAVARELKLRLGEHTLRSVTETTKPKAYEHFLLGQFFFNRREPGDLERALKQYQIALRDDPDDARAWTGAAGVYRVRIYENGRDQHQELVLMKQAVERALALNPQLAEAQIRAAHYYLAAGQIDKAWEHYYKAKALDPNAPSVLATDASMAVWEGQYNQAVTILQSIVAQDPLGVVNVENLAEVLVYAGRYEDAKTEFQRAMALAPERRAAIDARIGLVLILQGRPADALTRIENLQDSADRDEVLAMIGPALGRTEQSTAAIKRLAATPDVNDAIRLAEVYAYLGHNDAAFDWLQRAHTLAGVETLSDTAINWLEPAFVSPFLRPLHSDPRWKKWTASVGIDNVQISN